MKSHRHAEAVSHGVEELLARLKAEGLEAGKKEGEALLESARQEAQAILQAARAETERVLSQARRDAETERQSAQDALQAAVRDAVLALRQNLMDRFSADLQRLVSETMADPAVIRAMVLEAAAGAGAAVQVTACNVQSASWLPQEDDDDALRRDSEAIKAQPATGVLLASLRSVLAEGVSLDSVPGGAILRLRQGTVEIDLSDEAVGRLIVARLAPRFRALFDGVNR